MTSRQETGMALIAGGGIIIIIILLMLCGCTTKKTVTEHIYVHDTTTVYHSDTIKDIRVEKDTVVDYKVIATHDTVHHEIERLIVVNEQGDTIKQRELERLWQKIHDMEMSHHNESHSDSTSYLKAVTDSLRKVLDQQSDKTVTKVNERVPLKWILITIVAVAITVLIVARDIKNKLKGK